MDTSYDISNEVILHDVLLVSVKKVITKFSEEHRERLFVRVTVDGNSFHPPESLFKKVFADLLHNYCLGQDRSILASTRPETFYCSAIKRSF